MSISGLLGLTEMAVFGKFTWLGNNGIKLSFSPDDVLESALRRVFGSF